MAGNLKNSEFWIKTLIGAVIGALVSGSLAFLGAYLGSTYAGLAKTEQFRVQLNSNGVGFPALLFNEVRREQRELKIDFNPESLQRLRVCEYYADRQESFF